MLDVSVEDDAEYACVLRNCAGESRCEAELHVAEPADPKEAPTEVDLLKVKLDGARTDTEVVAENTYAVAGKVRFQWARSTFLSSLLTVRLLTCTRNWIRWIRI